MFDTLRHGNDLSEIMIEGHNPRARQKLNDAATQALRQHLQAPNTLLAYVCGREVKSGAGVMALSEGKVLVYQSATNHVTALALPQINQVQAVRGKYGHTVRVIAQGHTHALFGVDKDLALQMHQALLGAGVQSSFEDKAPLGTLWAAYPSPQPSANDCLADAQQRLMAA